jgi:hypothetical protein
MGREKEAEEMLQEFTQRFDGRPVMVAELLAYMNKNDQAFKWLDRAYVQRSLRLGYAKTNPLLANLHGDPRWDAFLERMNLAP